MIPIYKGVYTLAWGGIDLGVRFLLIPIYLCTFLPLNETIPKEAIFLEKSGGNTALHLDAIRGFENIVKPLLEGDADPLTLDE